MKRITLAALSLFALASFGALAQEGTLKKIKDTGTITIGHRDASLPFSYYDDKQQPIGYAMDLCMKIADAVKAELKLPKLEIKYQLVTSANRIPLMGNGTIDLECGSTTNNIPRQEQVWFTITHFVTANRWVAKKSSNVKKLADLLAAAGNPKLMMVIQEILIDPAGRRRVATASENTKGPQRRGTASQSRAIRESPPPRTMTNGTGPGRARTCSSGSSVLALSIGLMFSPATMAAGSSRRSASREATSSRHRSPWTGALCSDAANAKVPSRAARVCGSPSSPRWPR